MSGLALVVVDMLNRYDHDDADVLAEHVARVLRPLAGIVEQAVATEDVDLVYVNDNYGDFTATREDLVRAALAGRHPELVAPVVPPEGVAFLQKVRHSAFYSTALDHLLRDRAISTIVLAGQVTEQCVLYSALDAYVRGLSIRVAQDAVAPIDPRLGDAALAMMRRNMRVELLDAEDCLRPSEGGA